MNNNGFLPETSSDLGSIAETSNSGQRKQFRSILRVFQRSRLSIVGALIVGVLIITAIAAPWIAPHDPNDQTLMHSLRPPSWQEGGMPEYVLGTDQFGRDILSRIIYGGRVTLITAFLAALLAALFGTIMGLFGGYYGGRVDSIVSRIVDIFLGFPLILLALALVAVLGANLQNLVLAMAITGWMIYTRVIRGNVLTLREQEFVHASRALGASNFRIIMRHILPNVYTPILVLITLEMARLVLIEASLSYLGLGVPPPTPTWGRMLAESRDYMLVADWLVIFPGLAIMLTVLGINFLGDGLRDAFDPKLKNF
jgi:peptide/nickel transport system permease protein